LGQRLPAFVLLAANVGLARLALGVEGIELLFEPLLRRLAGVDRAANAGASQALRDRACRRRSRRSSAASRLERRVGSPSAVSATVTLLTPVFASARPSPGAAIVFIPAAVNFKANAPPFPASRRQTGESLSALISLIQPALISLATTFFAAPPLKCVGSSSSRSWRAAAASSIERCVWEISLNIVGPLASAEAERFSARH
jgi:hypothetical protein